MNDDAPAAGGFGKSLKHELRTPLNHIIGYSEILIEDAQDRGLGSALADLQRILAAGRHLLSVVNDLFDPQKSPIFRKDPSLLEHELRTPLNQIIGYGQILREDAPDFASDLAKIDSAARKLQSLVGENFQGNREWWNESARDFSAPPASTRTANNKGRILVVDDDESNRDMLSRRLKRLGHDVGVAENGRHALEVLAAETFDLMLLDLQMPHLNGYQVLERLRADRGLRELPVIVLSASDDAARIAHCIEMGAADYLAKPFEPVLLRARIDACLERKRLRDRERLTQERLNAELSEAATFVSSLFPAPLTGRVESEWCFHPSERLGGDAFGYHWLDDDHLAIYLLDVCGHGVGAALLSVSVLNTIRARALPGADFHDAAGVLSALNIAFPAEAQNFFYFTMWYGVYRVSTRELSFSSGGHPPALLLADGSATSLATDGAAIGCFDGAPFTSRSQIVPPGARLLVFSDGVFEIFLEGERVQTWEEYLASFGDVSIRGMRPAERLTQALCLRGEATLEDDFSFLELRFP